MSIPLGPFDLEEPVGKGGMAAVWRGVHRAQGIPVAVKVLQPPAGQDQDEALRGFHHEVRAVSALDHPGIVLIFDHGQLPVDTARASDGRLEAGAPYLVMEFASQGTLRQLGRPTLQDPSTGASGSVARPSLEPTGPTDRGSGMRLGWTSLRQVLLALLDALAHAHARGVLHRDLKPDNVLLCGPRDLRPGIKLSDFGIARPLDDDFELEDKPVGTPQYMSPEQLRNDRDAFGPHTDLYALGHLAWRMATGRLAWHGLSGPSLVYAQLRKEPPPFSPSFPVPSGLEDVLRTLLQKEPHDRYRCAADCALALSRLPEVPDDASTGEEPRDTGTLRVVIGGAGDEGSLGPEIRPALPDRFVADVPRPVRLLGAGLGLFGLRPVPFVGRERELDRAWRELVRLHVDGRARALVVRGPTGVGRTRFLAHLAQRAHELGAAQVLHATRTGGGSVLDRLGEPLVRFLHAHPLSPQERERRFGEFLKGLKLAEVRVADAIGLLLDREELDLPEVQRFAIVRRTLELMAGDRPLVVVCDDAADSPDALKLARQLLTARERSKAPVLFATSVPSETDDAELRRHLDVLDLHEAAATIELAPFVGEARHSLVRAIAPLDGALERRVVERTGGLPLHAVQWVSDQVARDRLVPGPGGYTSPGDGRPEPDALPDVWDRRIRTVGAGIEAPGLMLLERAAVGGVAVDVFEWQVACDDPEGEHAAQGRSMFHPRRARIRAALMDALFETGLARPTETGFVFAHQDLQRALIQRARDAGRFRDHAAACAVTLSLRATDATAGRCARLHLDAGRPDRALPLLLRAESWERRSRGPSAALATLRLAEKTLRAVRAPDDDRRWVEVWTRRAEAEEEAADWARARRSAGEAHLRARSAGYPDLDARAQMVLGAAALASGDAVAAEDHWQRVVRLLGEDGPVPETVKAWRWLRRLAAARGDRREVEARGAQVEATLARARSPAERIPALLALAEHLADTPRAAEGAARASDVVELANDRRDVASAAKAWSLLAGVAEQGRDWSHAREAWMHAVELLEDLGDDRRAAMARCRWGFVEARDNRWQAARAVVEPAAQLTEPRVAAGVHAVRALASAGRGNWGLCDRELEAARAHVGKVPPHELVFVEVFLMVADLCRAAKQGRRERAALLLARDRLVAAGRTDLARGVVARLDAARDG